MERVTLVDAGAAGRAAQAAFEDWRRRFSDSLPQSAEVEHVGATAIPDALTKGDLDIAVRVNAADFATALSVIEAHHRPNLRSVRDETFAAFEGEAASLPFGVQLVVKGSRLDLFTGFRDALIADPQLVERYNALKQRHDGGDMALYREAKAAFVKEVLAGR